jgi:two-component system, NarL family, nitrate/nitrite sensor histidine kinase NarX
MKPTSIQYKTGLIFLAFAALVVISVGATYWGINTQRNDAMIINQSGRQRMLIHYMTRLVLEYEQSGDPALLQSLDEAVYQFEKTLLALTTGNLPETFPERNTELPAATNPEILGALEKVNITWVKFKDNLIEVKDSQPDKQRLSTAISSLQALSDELIEYSEGVVYLYEAESIAKLNRLYQVQFAFLVGAFLLLVISGSLVYRTLIIPLRKLDSAAERIGKGDLSNPVSVSGPAEVHLLGKTLESMREQLLDSHSQLQAWGKTLEEKVAQRTRELDALSTVSREISSRLDISNLLQSITDKTCQLLSSEVAFLCLLEFNGETLKLHASSGPEEAVSLISSQIADGPINKLLEGEKAIPCHANGCRSFCGIMSHPFQASHLAAPLKVESRVIGALCVGSSSPNTFSQESTKLLMKLAYAAAVALENARLFERAERTATLEERQRIAAEMHDGLAQTISTLQMMVELARNQLEKGFIEKAEITLQRGRAAIDQASSDIRYAIDSLQEDFPINLTLQDQMAALVTEFSGEKMNLAWEDKTNSPIIVPHQFTEQLLRITREALLNACSHSNAENVTVSLESSAGYGTITIKDDGGGFDYHAALKREGDRRKRGTHFGLKIMQARAARIGGNLKIHSILGSGTSIKLDWHYADTKQVRKINGKEVEVHSGFYRG